MRYLAEKLNFLDTMFRKKQMNAKFFNNVSTIISMKADEVTWVMVFSKNPWLIVSWKYVCLSTS